MVVLEIRIIPLSGHIAMVAIEEFSCESAQRCLAVRIASLLLVGWGGISELHEKKP